MKCEKQLHKSEARISPAADSAEESLKLLSQLQLPTRITLAPALCKYLMVDSALAGGD